LKETSQTIFGEANFELHKWHSNDPDLETTSTSTLDQQQSYAKEQLGVKQGETKLLGLPWKKGEDTIAVKVSQQKAEPTRRGILGNPCQNLRSIRISVANFCGWEDAVP
jgi:hypothetical protein